MSAGQSSILAVPLDDNTRGEKYLDYCRLATDYPIGIFRSWTWIKMPTSLFIYPQPKGNLPLPLLSENQGIDDGNINLRGIEDFNDLKEYQAGDNLRHIVWKKASLGDVRVKTFQDLSGQECVLDFNNEKIRHLSAEDKLSQLCQWILQAEKQGIKYALILPNFRTDLSIGSSHKTRCLEALACY